MRKYNPLHYADGVRPETATIVVRGQRDVDGLVLDGDPRGRVNFCNADGSSDVYAGGDAREVEPLTGRQLVIFSYAEFRPAHRWG